MKLNGAWRWRNVPTFAVVGILILTTGCSRHVEVNGSRPATQVAIQALLFATDKYFADCGVPLPTNAPLAALVDNPGIPGWAGPYIRRTSQGPVPLDAWGRDFRVQTDATFLVIITSAGRDGIFGTPDDIVGTKQCRKPNPDAVVTISYEGTFITQPDGRQVQKVVTFPWTNGLTLVRAIAVTGGYSTPPHRHIYLVRNGQRTLLPDPRQTALEEDVLQLQGGDRIEFRVAPLQEPDR